jgi:hypothetical protein
MGGGSEWGGGAPAQYSYKYSNVESDIKKTHFFLYTYCIYDTMSSDMFFAHNFPQPDCVNVVDSSLKGLSHEIFWGSTASCIFTPQYHAPAYSTADCCPAHLLT